MSLRFAQSSRRLKIQALEEVKETKTPVQNLVTILPHLLVKVDRRLRRIKADQKIEVYLDIVKLLFLLFIHIYLL